MTHRWLLGQWARRDFRVRYRQSLLGPLWAVVQPTVLLAFYGLLFTRALGVRPDRGPYLLFAWCGLAVWTFFANSVGTAAASLVGAQSLITKVYFPRAIVPLAAVLVAGIDLAIATVVLVALSIVTGHGVAITFVALPLVFLGVVMLAGAVGVIASAIAVFARDLLYGLPLALQAAFIATPVMYPPDIVPERHRWIHEWNPVAVTVEQVRRIVLDGRWPDVSSLAVLTVVGAVALAAAVAYLHAVEHRFADVA